MKSLRCLAGRHEWRSGVDKDDQPYEVCVQCKHYRYPDSGGSRFRSDVYLPPTEGSSSATLVVRFNGHRVLTSCLAEDGSARADRAAGSGDSLGGGLGCVSEDWPLIISDSRGSPSEEDR